MTWGLGFTSFTSFTTSAASNKKAPPLPSGRLMTWGLGFAGQLGQGDLDDRARLVAVKLVVKLVKLVDDRARLVAVKLPG